jgi:membrane protease YdiL (CAAX protease family)
MNNSPSAQARIKPMPLWMAILFFGIPALVFRASVYLGMPSLLNLGVPWFGVYVICYGSVLFLMLLAAFVACRLEGFRFSWKELRERLWLRSLNGKDWVWILGGFFAAVIGYLLFSFSERWIANIPSFAPPAAIAYLDPRNPLPLSYTSFMDIPLLGNWGMFLAIFLLLVLNILGEELWWRSYILPRQELSGGKKAWLVNGLLWSLFHVVSYPWTVLSYLPICLTVPFVTQRLRKAPSGMVIHFLLNMFHLWIPITLGVLGIRL